jgi:hypothetical protein
VRPITSTLSDSRLGSRRAIAIEGRPFHPLQRLIGRRPDAAVSRNPLHYSTGGRSHRFRETAGPRQSRRQAATIGARTGTVGSSCSRGSGPAPSHRTRVLGADAADVPRRPPQIKVTQFVNYCKTMSTPGDGSRGWRAARFCSSVAVGACPLLDLPEVGLPDGTVGHRHCRGDDASAPRTGRDRNR